MVIADSNAWIDYFRNLASPTVQTLADLIRTRRVAIVGIVLAEILRGARSEDELADLKVGLRGARYLEMTAPAWERAGLIARTLDLEGKPIPLADMIIAGFALEHDHEVLTRDHHFERIPDLKLYQPKGGADV